MAGARSLIRRALFVGRLAPPPRWPLPPGATEATLEACTGCSACASACPMHIVVMEGGRPRLDFSKGECVFCGDCADACPELVFATDRPARFQHIVQVSDSCLAVRGVACMACRDACPSNAIYFRPRIGTPFVPEIRGESCTGCGACIAPCPVDAISVAAKEGGEAASA